MKLVKNIKTHKTSTNIILVFLVKGIDTPGIFYGQFFKER